MTNLFAGYTESQAMTEARARRNQEWAEQRELCNQIVTELEPEIMNIRYAVASAFIIPLVVTLSTQYDQTPTPSDMPVIDFDKVDEVEF